MIWDAVEARRRMVALQLAARDISDEHVLDAMGRIPRERFVGAGLEHHAYDDRPLPIGNGQTISQPYIVAKMAELAELAPHHRVLEVGAGCGYASAVLSLLAAHVYAVEIVPELAERAAARLRSLGIDNVHVSCRDGSGGWPEHAPYDAIIVSAAAPRVPVLLVDQLVDGGRLVIPVGGRDEQSLSVVRRRGDTVETEIVTLVRFVSLVGRHGWGGEPPSA